MPYWKNQPSTLTLADGTAMTTANSAAPDALSPAKSGTGTVNWVAGDWVCTGDASSVARIDKAVTGSPRSAIEIMYDQAGEALPSAVSVIASLNSVDSVGSAVRVSMTTAGILELRNSGGVLLYSTPAAVTGRFRLYLGAEVGTGTADGEVHFAVYVGAAADGATATYSYDSSTTNAGTANFTIERCGKITAATVHELRVEYVHGSTDQYTALGPLVANTAPIANAGADQTVEPWSPVPLTGTDSDTENNVITRAWTQLTGTPVTLAGTGATRTFTAPPSIAGETLTFRYTVTDAGGLSSSAPVSVTVLPVTERAVIGGVEVPMQIRAN